MNRLNEWLTGRLRSSEDKPVRASRGEVHASQKGGSPLKEDGIELIDWASKEEEVFTLNEYVDASLDEVESKLS